MKIGDIRQSDIQEAQHALDVLRILVPSLGNALREVVGSPMDQHAKEIAEGASSLKWLLRQYAEQTRPRETEVSRSFFDNIPESLRTALNVLSITQDPKDNSILIEGNFIWHDQLTPDLLQVAAKRIAERLGYQGTIRVYSSNGLESAGGSESEATFQV